MKKTIAIFAAFALVFGFAATAMAADWDFYGSARFATFYTTSDEDSPTRNSKLKAGEDESDLQWDLQGNARIGATVNSGDVGGGFEYGSGPNLRKLYGTWNFGAGELLIGQTYTPTVQFYSNQVFAGDNDLLGVGQFYNGRAPMIQLKMGGFKVALVKPSVGTPNTTTTLITLKGVGASPVAVANTKTGLFGATTVVDTEVTLPKIELAYKFSTDMFSIEPFAGYQTYDIVDNTNDSESVDAYVLGVYGSVNFGPATISLGGYFAENSGAYGAFQGYGASSSGAGPTLNSGKPKWNATSNELEDNEEYGGIIVANFKINDMLSAEVGAGMVSNELKGGTGNAKQEQDIMSFYANLPINLADGVFIVPEIGQFDFGKIKEEGKADVEKGSDIYFGAKWQINF